MPEKITVFTSRAAPLPVNNIDTDQIIPARFLKTISKAGIGENLFADWRYNEDRQPRPEFVLNRPEFADAHILIAGDNFGCGSSREHAPWALQGCGFKAVISTSFGDIFRNNSLKNGLLPITVDASGLAQLFALVQANPTVELTVNLPEQKVVLPGGAALFFPIDNFSKECLILGVDQLGYLLNKEDNIQAYEQSHAARVNTLSV